MAIPTAPPPGPRTPRKAQSKNIFIGCLVALGVFILLVGVGGWWLYTTVRGALIDAIVNEVRPQIVAQINASPLPESNKRGAIAAVDRIVGDIESGRISVTDQMTWIDPAREASHAWIAELELPDEQKAGIKAQFDRLADGSLDGSIGQVEWDAITNELSSGTITRMLAAWAMKVKYVYPSQLTDEEKAAAEATIDRIARGVVEDKITEPELQAIAKPYETIDPQTGNATAKDLTPDELRELIATLESLADKKEIPTDAWEPDYAGELKKAIDKALGVPAATP